MVVDNPYGKFHNFYSVSTEYFGHLHICSWHHCGTVCTAITAQMQSTVAITWKHSMFYTICIELWTGNIALRTEHSLYFPHQQRSREQDVTLPFTQSAQRQINGDSSLSCVKQRSDVQTVPRCNELNCWLDKGLINA
jgi:hypothetical protein